MISRASYNPAINTQQPQYKNKHLGFGSSMSFPNIKEVAKELPDCFSRGKSISISRTLSDTSKALLEDKEGDGKRYVAEFVRQFTKKFFWHFERGVESANARLYVEETVQPGWFGRCVRRKPRTVLRPIKTTKNEREHRTYLLDSNPAYMLEHLKKEADELTNPAKRAARIAKEKADIERCLEDHKRYLEDKKVSERRNGMVASAIEGMFKS